MFQQVILVLVKYRAQQVAAAVRLTRRRMGMKSIALCLVAILLVGSRCGSSEDAHSLAPDGPTLFTMLEIYQYPITDIVGERVALQTKVTWHEGPPYDWDTGYFNEDTLLVWNLSVLWEEADDYIPHRFQNEERGNILMESPDIRKEFDEDGIQAFYFDDVKLSKSTTYVLTGRFGYRDWMSPPPLDNPKFIEQSNNPVYWSQTFEFQCVDLQEMR
jgi:hypothetical protein